MRAWAALRPALLAVGVGAVGWLVYQIGAQAIWEVVRPLGWRLPVLLCFPSGVGVIVGGIL